MKLLHQAWLLSLVLLLFHSASAQTRKPVCPSLGLQISQQTIVEGDVVTLKAMLNGRGIPAHLNFQWTVSVGEILSGQGTSMIQIKTDYLGGSYVTATVEIKGLQTNCAALKTETFAIKPGCPNFKLELPTAPVEEGQPAVFTAKVTGSGSHRATFHWMVSAGKIRRGQATSIIEVDTNKLGGVGFLAAVELGGLAPACRSSEVVALMIAKKGNKKTKRREAVEE